MILKGEADELAFLFPVVAYQLSKPNARTDNDADTKGRRSDKERNESV